MTWMLRVYDDNDEVFSEARISYQEAKQLVGREPVKDASNPVPNIIDMFVHWDDQRTHKRVSDWQDKLHNDTRLT